MKHKFLILDFGSQFTQLITRRLREFGVYSEVARFDISLDEIRDFSPTGIILSGGPHSVYEDGAPIRGVRELGQIAPVLGICYGMQLIAKEFGGEVLPSEQREYGLNKMSWIKNIHYLQIKDQKVWMSHGDVVKRIPDQFELMAVSQSGHAAVMTSDRFWGFQFHPEVTHTEFGTELLKEFVFTQCQASADWQTPQMVDHLIHRVQSHVPQGERVLCGLSGGVDSTVVGVLVTRALGADRVQCVFVDTGLLRKNEYEEVLDIYKKVGLNVTGVQARDLFLNRLKGISDPEQKRKIIGHSFIDVFKNEIQNQTQNKNQNRAEWLAQGTLYPDVIESVSPRGASVTIKSHHNVGGLPKDLNLKLLEPVRELFKDEVRALGRELGLPAEFLGRHPFPGPGLAIRIPGVVDEMSLKILREADAIFIEEIKKAGLYSQIWQAFCVLLPVYTVGVQGDGRTYERVLALRAVTSLDGMTADWYDFNTSFLRFVSNRITNEVRGVNRVVYDVTSKPPGTIEWE